MMVEATSPIIRYVWGEHFGYFLSEEEPLNPQDKVMHTERQTFIGIPDSDIGVFLIRKKVILYQDNEEGWDYPATTAKQLKWNNRLQIRTPPPSQ